MDGLYVFNNPWSVQSMEKATTYALMMHLGLPVPDTWLVPPKEHEPSADLEPTLERYAELFDLAALGERLGYPLYMKPYDGGAWVGVTKIDDDVVLARLSQVEWRDRNALNRELQAVPVHREGQLHPAQDLLEADRPADVGTE